MIIDFMLKHDLKYDNWNVSLQASVHYFVLGMHTDLIFHRQYTKDANNLCFFVGF